MWNTPYMLQRVAELAARQAKGQPLSPAEQVELTQLTQGAPPPVAPAVAPPPLALQTTLKTLTVAEAQMQVAEQMGNPAMLPLAEKNLLALRRQGIDDPNKLVAVEVVAPVDSSSTLLAMQAQIDLLKAQMAAQGAAAPTGAAPAPTGAAPAGGAGQPPANQAQAETPAPAPASDAAPPAEQTAKTDDERAVEAFDTYAKKFATVHAAFQKNSKLSKEEADKLVPGWTIRDIITAGAILSAKMSELLGTIDELIPNLEHLTADGQAADGAAPPAPATKGANILADEEDVLAPGVDLPNGVNLSQIVRQREIKKDGDPAGGGLEVSREPRRGTAKASAPLSYRDRLEARRATRLNQKYGLE